MSDDKIIEKLKAAKGARAAFPADEETFKEVCRLEDGTADGAIYFETEDQAVALQIDDIWGNWTASFWVKPDAVTHHSFLCSSMTGSLRVIQDDGRVGATMNGIVDKSVPYQIPLGTWTMLTFVYDEELEYTSVYIDGEFFDGMY